MKGFQVDLIQREREINTVYQGMYMEPRKMGNMILPAGQGRKGDTDIKNRPLNPMGGEGGMI